MPNGTLKPGAGNASDNGWYWSLRHYVYSDGKTLTWQIMCNNAIFAEYPASEKALAEKCLQLLIDHNDTPLKEPKLNNDGLYVTTEGLSYNLSTAVRDTIEMLRVKYGLAYEDARLFLDAYVHLTCSGRRESGESRRESAESKK